MEFGRIGVLCGPNIWGNCPVLEVELQRRAGGARLDGTPAFAERLLRWVPSLAGEGEGPPFQGPLGLAHALGRLTIRLQSQAGSEVHLHLVDGRGDRPVRVVV